MENPVEIRECTTLDEMAECVELQREVFALPKVEVSPIRHFVITRNAGGFTLGAYHGERLVGFVHSLPAYMRAQRAFYSHMTAVRPEYQSHGIGAQLKWAQRTRALSDGVKYIKWTFEPVKARNAYFNLEKLGAVITEYSVNFYGTDYATAPGQSGRPIGLASDRLFAEWHLDSEKVASLAAGHEFVEVREPAAKIETMNDFLGMVERDAEAALSEQIRIRGEFQAAFGRGLIVRGFRRDAQRPAFLLYES